MFDDPGKATITFFLKNIYVLSCLHTPEHCAGFASTEQSVRRGGVAIAPGHGGAISALSSPAPSSRQEEHSASPLGTKSRVFVEEGTGDTADAACAGAGTTVSESPTRDTESLNNSPLGTALLIGKASRPSCTDQVGKESF